jgi:tyrosyl-tRNA synthetase
MKEERLEPQVCLTVPLLVGLDGHEKMSKSLGNAIAVDDTPREVYGKTMSIPDALMWDWLLLLTDVATHEIASRKTAVERGDLHPKRVKQELARTLVAQFHGEAAAGEAEAEFERIFAGGGAPDEVPEIAVAAQPLAGALLAAGLVPSRKEAQRMVEQRAVTIDGELAGSWQHELAARAEPYLVKVGKRRFARLRVR